MIDVADIRQEVDLPGQPHEVYETLLDSRRHSALTGLPCRIDRRHGGDFEVGEGMIEGTILELVPDQQIVQTWRISSYGWPSQHFSRLDLKLQSAGAGTHVLLEQTGVPKICLQFIEAGWYQFYWGPLGVMQRA